MPKWITYFSLINDRWKNAISRCGSRPSDCRCALEIGPRKRDKRQLFQQNYRTPTQTQKHAYNLFVEQKIEEQRHLDNWNCTKAFDTLADILIQSADKYFTRIPAEQKKPYLSETTWNLIEAKQKAIEAYRKYKQYEWRTFYLTGAWQDNRCRITQQNSGTRWMPSRASEMAFRYKSKFFAIVMQRHDSKPRVPGVL